ncbi:MAG: hypothetical protein ACOX35_05560 [Bacillota bacterium]
MSGLIIRAARAADKEEIAKLIAQFRAELKQLKGISADPDIEQARKEFDEYLEAGFPIFVAEDTASIVEDTAKDGNGGLLGYLVCRVDGDVVWAESLFV